jgi:hypothetical protein
MKTNVFVFGSNLAGRHGAGSAKEAVSKHGAIYGKGVGLQGKSYGIPTKDANLKTLPLDMIERYVSDFVEYAWNHPMYTFNIVPIGCGLAGYTPEQIAPFFEGCPTNCNLPPEFTQVIYATNTQVY